MAKKSMVARGKLQERTMRRERSKREALKEIVYNRELTPDERMAATLKLAAMPRRGSLTRHRRRCLLSGRPRGVYRKFGLCRNMLRKYATQGEIPGLVKASW